MECRYCRAWNDDDEHRCCRCGRRLRASTARPAPDTYPISSATAPALLGLYDSVTKNAGAAPARESEPAVQQVAWQRGLFPETQRVIAMPSLAQAEPTRSQRSAPRAPRGRRPVDGQQNLNLNSPLNTQVEAVIYCDVPVALPAHRAMATALDTSMVLIGLGLFLLTFHLAGGDIVINSKTITLFAGITVTLAIFYHLLFCLSGGDTAGMRWTQLRLVNFDGQDPDREQRIYRMVGGCLSFVAAGLGLVWALVDEESLTWHDHMSKTFPSPDQSR